MANSNLTFNSWVKIISDTATNFAKKGENHNICFQSVFLHGIQVLNHIHLKLPYQCSKSWGIIFSCSGCLWKIGEEKFTLEKTAYEGLHLEKKVTDLRPRAQPKRVSHLRRSKGGSTAYSIMTARKVVQWVKDNDITPSLYLDQRRVKEVVTASFLNLAELRHLDVQLFLELYVMYHYLYVPSSMSNKRIITDPILNTKGSKTSHDVLIDTLSRSNYLRFLEGSYIGLIIPCFNSSGNSALSNDRFIKNFIGCESSSLTKILRTAQRYIDLTRSSILLLLITIF